MASDIGDLGMVMPGGRVLRAASWDRVAETLAVEGAELRVHSSFERALNLVAPAGELLGLVGPPADNGPATIVLAALPADGLQGYALASGMAARIADGRLAIGERVAVDLRAARSWEPARLPPIPPASVLRRRLALAEQIAAAAAPSGGLTPLLPHLALLDEWTRPTGRVDVPPLDPVGRAAWQALAALLPAWRRDDLAGVRRAAAGLVGLGPGLTPSGDDLLAGLLVGTARARAAVPAELGSACLAAAEGRTSDVAYARIRHAAHGAIEEVQETVIAALVGGDDSRIVAAVERAARWGHTSGADTLVGLFLALRISTAPARRRRAG